MAQPFYSQSQQFSNINRPNYGYVPPQPQPQPQPVHFHNQHPMSYQPSIGKYSPRMPASQYQYHPYAQAPISPKGTPIRVQPRPLTSPKVSSTPPRASSPLSPSSPRKSSPHNKGLVFKYGLGNFNKNELQAAYPQVYAQVPKTMNKVIEIKMEMQRILDQMVTASGGSFVPTPNIVHRPGTSSSSVGKNSPRSKPAVSDENLFDVEILKQFIAPLPSEYPYGSVNIILPGPNTENPVDGMITAIRPIFNPDKYICTKLKKLINNAFKGCVATLTPRSDVKVRLSLDSTVYGIVAHQFLTLLTRLVVGTFEDLRREKHSRLTIDKLNQIWKLVCAATNKDSHLYVNSTNYATDGLNNIKNNVEVTNHANRAGYLVAPSFLKHIVKHQTEFEKIECADGFYGYLAGILDFVLNNIITLEIVRIAQIQQKFDVNTSKKLTIDRNHISQFYQTVQFIPYVKMLSP